MDERATKWLTRREADRLRIARSDGDGDAAAPVAGSLACRGNQLCRRCVNSCDETIRRVGAVFALREAELDDFIQDAWLEVLSALARGRYDPRRGTLANWLFVLARNRAVTRFRRPQGARAVAAAPLELLPGPSSDDPAAILDRRCEVQRVRHALEVLRQQTPIVSYAALHLRRIKQMSVSEVAQTLQLSPEQVRSLDYRAYRKLAMILRKFDAF
jgi:RNA polymerase sigma factor (sigma-70 family)